MDNIIEWLKEQGCSINLTGSVAICNPPPTDTDTDYLVYTGMNTDDSSSLIGELAENGWTQDGDGESYEMLCESSFVSMRRGKINLIITNQLWFKQRHRSATAICKALNLLDKSQRIMVFKAVLYNEIIDERPILDSVAA